MDALTTTKLPWIILVDREFRFPKARDKVGLSCLNWLWVTRRRVEGVDANGTG